MEGNNKNKKKKKKTIDIFSKDVTKYIKIEILTKEISKRAKKIQKFIRNNVNRNTE